MGLGLGMGFGIGLGLGLGQRFGVKGWGSKSGARIRDNFSGEVRVWDRVGGQAGTSVKIRVRDCLSFRRRQCLLSSGSLWVGWVKLTW